MAKPFVILIMLCCLPLFGCDKPQPTYAQRILNAGEVDIGSILPALNNTADNWPRNPNQKQIEQLVDKVALLLGGGVIMSRLDAARIANNKIRDLRDEIARQSYARDLEKRDTLNSQLDQANKDYDRTKKEVMEKLSEIGVKLSSDKADVLVRSVDGGERILLLSMQNNLAYVIKELGDILEKNKNDRAHAARYYKLNVVLGNTVETLQTDVRNQIRQTYLPRLTEVELLIIDQQEETARLIGNSDNEKDKVRFENNLRIQNAVATLIPEYRKRLVAQLKELGEKISKTRKWIQLADNTANTFELTQRLRELKEESERDFGSVVDIPLPDILPLNANLLEAWDYLSREMAKPR